MRRRHLEFLFECAARCRTHQELRTEQRCNRAKRNPFEWRESARQGAEKKTTGLDRSKRCTHKEWVHD